MLSKTCAKLIRVNPIKFLKEKIHDLYRIIDKMDNAQLKQIRKSLILGASATAIHIIIGTACPVFAAGGIANNIIQACQPIIELIQGLGYPVCLCVMTGGGVTMAFNRRKGIQLIKDGAIAYIVIQFVPLIMKLLVQVGGAAIK
jgi:hypothetical protein